MRCLLNDPINQVRARQKTTSQNSRPDLGQICSIRNCPAKSGTKSGTISRILSRPGREGSDKDGLNMGCENGKLFFAEPKGGLK